MEEMTKWFNTEAQNLYAIERAAELYAIFVGIHPFIGWIRTNVPFFTQP
ncbi:hypothetical protein [Sutcliffiella horikoshii]